MNWLFGSLVGAKRWMCSRVGRRLGFAFSMVTLLMVLMAVVSSWQLWQLDRQFATVLDDRLHKLSALQGLDTELNALNLAARDAIIGADSDLGKAAIGRIEAGRTRIGQQIEDLQKMLKGEGAESVAIAERLGNDSSGILVTMVKFSRLHKAGRMDAARALFGSQLQPQMRGLSSTVSQVQALQMTGFELAKQQAHGGMHAALATNGAMLSLALVLSGVFAWRLSLSITRPMVEAVRLAESVASGDLSSLVRVQCTDEVGRLLQAMVAMQSRLGEMVNGILSSVDGIKRTSVEIASGNHDLSLRTERTATSLQSTALAMEQLSATVRQSTQTACSVHELVSSASRRAEQGGHVVSEVVANMQQIAQSSHRIGDITGVIDGIAFQTNILALNAAVEAARAGEQGRGFAVVAAEVRALAQRSAAAAKEIKVLIEASVDKVGQGSKLVDQAGQTMQDLMSQVHGVSDLITSITTASQAQSDGVGQVSGAVIELDQATKQNASLVHETSRSAGHLQSESERLYEAVSVFKLAS